MTEAHCRELALYAATNPGGFYKRTITVCEDCALTVGSSDMRKAQVAVPQHHQSSSSTSTSSSSDTMLEVSKN